MKYVSEERHIHLSVSIHFPISSKSAPHSVILTYILCTIQEEFMIGYCDVIPYLCITYIDR